MKNLELSQLQIGQSAKISRVITADQLASFVALTGDTNPLHTDLSYCKEMGLNDLVVHGLLTGSFFSALVGIELPGRNARLLNIKLNWLKPAFVGDEIHFIGQVTEISEAARSIELSLSAIRNGEKIIRGKALVELLK